MNRHILLLALILSLSIFANVAAKKGAVIQNQPRDDEREEELILIPEILNQLKDLEGESSDNTDLGPELPPNSDSDSNDQSSNEEPNLLTIEDDSDEEDNIYKQSQESSTNNETPENQEKNLLNIDDGEDEDGEKTDIGEIIGNESDGEIGTSPAEIDGKYHVIEAPTCTAIQIPIGKRSVRVTVEDILNANATMLTDGQFANCSELAQFICPENSTFCRTEVLDPVGANDFELHQEACGVENAYLYVLPSDPEIAFAMKVKVLDIGEPLCDDNSEAQINEGAEEGQEPELVPVENSESDEEQSSDDSDNVEDSEDSEDSDDSDDSDEEEINDNQIMEGTAQVDGKMQAFELEICTVIAIPINKQPVNIEVDNVFNCDKVMVTDAKIPNCDALREFKCPEDSTFCQVQDFDPIELISEACNTDTVYLYIYPEDWAGVVTYQVNITALNNDSCINQDSSVPVVPVAADESDDQTSDDTTDTTTPEEGTDNGTDNQPDANTPDTTTPTDNQPDTETPDTTTPTPSTQEGTDNQPDVSVGDNGDNQVDSTAASQGIADTGSKSNGGTIVAIIFGASLAIFLAVVCIYRRQFKKNRVELFNPPTWCPNCLFPRASATRLMSNPTGYGQIEYNEYEPPVL